MAKLVRIHFLNDSMKAFTIDTNSSAAQLKRDVVDKIGMHEDANFAIFEKKDGWERCLNPDDKPCELMSQWTNQNCCFIFKKRIFLRDDDKELQDPVAKNYVYFQALYSVIESEYPCGVEDAIRLAGLQVQITYGDKSAAHTTGFLSNPNNNLLKQIIPKDLLNQKKPADWEILIFKAHAFNKGKSEEDAKTEYIDIVKSLPYYGTTFYPPCKSITKKLPAKVIIGIRSEEIILLTRDKELVSTHPFTQICSWASSSTTFAFEFGFQTESRKYTFETRHGSIIAATIQTYIDILVQMLKSGEDDE